MTTTLKAHFDGKVIVPDQPDKCHVALAGSRSGRSISNFQQNMFQFTKWWLHALRCASAFALIVFASRCAVFGEEPIFRSGTRMPFVFEGGDVLGVRSYVQIDEISGPGLSLRVRSVFINNTTNEQVVRTYGGFIDHFRSKGVDGSEARWRKDVGWPQSIVSTMVIPPSKELSREFNVNLTDRYELSQERYELELIYDLRLRRPAAPGKAWVPWSTNRLLILKQTVPPQPR